MSAPASRPTAPLGLGRSRGARVVTDADSPFHRSRYATALNKGYGDAIGRGFELAITLVVVGGIGWLIDRVVGTYPVFTLVLSVAGFIGIAAKLWLGYDLEMRQLDHGAVWNRQHEGPTAPSLQPSVPSSLSSSDPSLDESTGA